MCAVSFAQGARPLQATTPAAGQEPAHSAVDETQYRIGPGDTLQVFVWNHPELTVTVPVRPDGQISTPLVENTTAAGQTPSELARNLETKLAEYVRTPKVNVIVTNAQSQFSQIRIVGQVRTPKAVPYHDGMTVMDAVLAAGGLGDFASGNRAKIVREQAGKQVEIRVRLSDLLNKGDLKQDVALEAGRRTRSSADDVLK